MLQITTNRTYKPAMPKPTTRRQPTHTELSAAYRTLTALYEQHELHTRLLCAICKFISQGRKVCVTSLAYELDSNWGAVYGLRRRYPKTFSLICQYEKARQLWEKGRKLNGLRQGEKSSKPNADPLMQRLELMHV